MDEKQVVGLLLCALGVALIATRRGAHAWWSNTWRMGDVEGTWFAAAFGPRVVQALHGLLGIATLGAGLWVLLSPG